MYCPECGKKLEGGAWRCEHCGSDLRRILREEYWNKEESKESSDSSSERFRIPDGTVSDVGWKSMQSKRRPAIIWTVIAVVSLALLIVLLFMAFRPPQKPDDPFADGDMETVSSQPTQPSEPVAEPDQPPEQPEPEVIPPEQPAVEPETTADTETETTPESENETDDETSDSDETSAEAEEPPKEPPPQKYASMSMNRETIEAYLQEWLDSWRKTYNTKEIEEFSTFYSDRFVSNTGKKKSRFMEAKLKVAEKTIYVSIETGVPEIVILNANKARVRFDQTYFSDYFSDHGKKLLTIAKEKDGFKIVSEVFEKGSLPQSVPASRIKETVFDWRKAWEDVAIQKSLGNLPDFYHANFLGGGMNKKAWMAAKMRVAQKFSIIAVDISNLVVFVQGDKAIARFNQKFRSDKYADEGTKVLVFVIEGGQPLITRELFKQGRAIDPLKFDDFWGP